ARRLTYRALISQYKRHSLRSREHKADDARQHHARATSEIKYARAEFCHVARHKLSRPLARRSLASARDYEHGDDRGAFSSLAGCEISRGLSEKLLRAWAKKR